MPTIFEKMKATIVSWLLATTLGAAFITNGISPDASIVIALAAFTFMYVFILGYSGEKKNSELFLVHPRSTMPSEELLALKARAQQLYAFHIEWTRKYPEKKLESAFEQALLRIVDQDEVLGSRRISEFSVFLTSYVDTFEIVNRKSNLTLDSVIVDLQKKKHRTNLQNDFMSFISSQIANLPGEVLGEAKLIYRVQNENLIVKQFFSNWFGFRLVSLLSLLDSKKGKLGLNELLNIEYKTPNK